MGFGITVIDVMFSVTARMHDNGPANLKTRDTVQFYLEIVLFLVVKIIPILFLNFQHVPLV